MKRLRYISVQPAIEYYTWQVEVMINNFIKNGINPNYIDIVCSINNHETPAIWRKLADTYNYVRFFFYNDDRVNPIYVSSVRPHILKKHFEAHPYLENEVIFYHDSDMVFTKPVNWNHLIDGDTWYLSDTNSYINADYIKSKKFGVYEEMCKIVGIPEDTPEKYNEHGGGAQYIMKNINAKYWEKVEDDSNKLYKFFLDHLITHPETPEYHPIQKWTADMWAVLWNAWYFGHDTKVVKEMDFCWPMNPLSYWENLTIYHNAGVIETSSKEERLFYKGKYVNGTLPYNDVQLSDFDETKCTHKYVQEILETFKRTVL